MNRSVESLKAFMAGSRRESTLRPVRGVLVVGAGKGGVGTSVVAGLLAVAAARSGAQVLLADGDEAVGSLHLMFGMTDPGPGLAALRGGKVAPRDLLVSLAPGLALLPGGGGGMDATFAVAAADRRVLFRRVAGLYEHFDLVVVDGGSRLDSVMAACATGAERLLCVTGSDRISLAGSYALFKVTRTRFPGLPAELVVNGATTRTGQGAHRVVEAATGSFLGAAVPLAGVVPDDQEIRDALRANRPLHRLAAAVPALEAAGAIVHRILREHTAALEGDAPLIPLPHARDL